MTLVYAKIIDMFVWGGQTQGVGGRGLVGGYLEISKTESNTQMAVCRKWGVWEWGNDGVGGWWGRGWGEALIEVLNKTGIVTSD